MLLLSCKFHQRQLSEPCLPFPTFWHPRKTHLHATGPQHFTKRWKAILPSPNVWAPGSCASSGLQTGAPRPPLRWARCSQHGPIPGCLPPDGHQARATRLLLWFWWGLSYFLEMYWSVHNLPGLHESCLGEGMECILCACKGLWLLALFSEVYTNKSMHTCKPWTFACKEETFWEGCAPHT